MNATNKHTSPKFGLRKTINGCAVEVSSDDRVAAANVAALLCAAPALLAALDVLLNSVDAVEIPAQGDGSKMAALYYAMEDARAALRLARGS